MVTINELRDAEAIQALASRVATFYPMSESTALKLAVKAWLRVDNPYRNLSVHVEVITLDKLAEGLEDVTEFKNLEGHSVGMAYLLHPANLWVLLFKEDEAKLGFLQIDRQRLKNAQKIKTMMDKEKSAKKKIYAESESTPHSLRRQEVQVKKLKAYRPSQPTE